MKTVLALGNFDGVHIGHLSVLEKAKKTGRIYSCHSAALLFDCHPAEYFGKKAELITRDDEREMLINDVGVKTEKIKFSEICNMSCEEFVQKILKDKYNCPAVCCGYNYHFGKNSSGDSETLKRECEKQGIEVFVCEKIEIDGEAVSSSLIRKLIKEGNISKANKMLGRNFFIKGKVICGEGNGKKMGFPTANQMIPENSVSPKNGVYISRCQAEGRIYRSITDIGVRPTFGENREKRIETFIFDCEDDLYGKELKVEFIEYLRDEKKFSGENELIKQLEKDIKIAKEYEIKKSVTSK